MKTQAIRKKLDPLINFFAKPFIYIGLTPNILSLLGIFVVIPLFPLLKMGYFYWAALLILFNGFFDVVDGGVARTTGKSSNFGKFLDRTIDKISDVVILSAYPIYGFVGFGLGLYTIATMFLATNISANIEGVLNFKISDAVSFRFLRILTLVVFTILKQFKIMFIILALMSTYSIVYRFSIAYSIGKKEKTN